MSIATQPLRMSFGRIQRKNEVQETREEIASRYLRAIDSAATAEGDVEKLEALTELAEAKQVLVGLLQSHPRKRVSLLGCVFHLHLKGDRKGVSVHRKLSKLRDVVPALIRSL